MWIQLLESELESANQSESSIQRHQSVTANTQDFLHKQVQ